MRIIAGAYRGTALADVGAGDAAAHLRPTSDRVRESLFSMIALGLEALSRGAREAVFVENGRVAQKLIAQNIAKLRVEDKTVLIRSDATQMGECAGGPFDLVFLDPPYGKGMGLQALVAARTGGWLAQGALVVWEENAAMDAPQGFTRTDRRKYGDTHVTLLRCD